MVEGSPTKPFTSQRKLRQGGLISPILFGLVMNVLSRLISSREVEEKIDSYQVNGTKFIHITPDFSKDNHKSLRGVN